MEKETKKEIRGYLILLATSVITGGLPMLVNVRMKEQLEIVFANIGWEHYFFAIGLLIFIYLLISFMVNISFKSKMNNEIKGFNKFKGEFNKLGEIFKKQSSFNYILSQYYIMNLINTQVNEDDVAKDIYNLMKNNSNLSYKEFDMLEILTKNGIKEKLSSKIAYLINQDRIKNNLDGDIK